MSRSTFCQMSTAMGHGPCPCWRPEDIARLARMLLTTAKVGVLALIVAVVLIVTVQWAFPLQISPGSGGASHFAVQPAAKNADDREVDRAVELFLAQFDDGATSGNAIVIDPRELP